MSVESLEDSAGGMTLRLFDVRDTRVILDRDLAAIYGVATKQLNQSVKRHAQRFPLDFAFYLSVEEWRRLRAPLPTRRGSGGLGHPPRVFTEQGVVMVATIMRGRRAVATTIELLRAFARIRAEPINTEFDIFESTKDLFTAREQLEHLKEELFGPDPGTVTYFIQAGEHGPIKIGITTELANRLRGLQTSSPEPLRLLGTVQGDIESMCHVCLEDWRLQGEWFKPTSEVLEFIYELIPREPPIN